MSSQTQRRRAEKLLEAKFDPRLKTYSYVGGIVIFTITIVGIILLPFWLIFGKIYINRYFDNLYCELTTRALHFKKGVWFQTERTIPLDKIQDLTFKEGPILRYFGLSYLMIETAGQSAQGVSDLSLTGIVDARNFRKIVLDQRDETTDKQSYVTSTPQTENGLNQDQLVPLLQDINKTLKKIEQRMEKRS